VQSLRKAADSDPVATIGCVRGMGGVGKTELAYKVVQQLAPDFPDAQILVELGGASTSPVSAIQALQKVIRAFDQQSQPPNDLNELQAIYRSHLTGKHYIILIDDARDAAQVKPLLPPAGCTLLITTRNRFSLPGMMVIDLGILSAEEAEDLLCSICPRIGDAASRLAALCGYLPLALRVSASLLETDDTYNIARYLTDLERARLKYLRDPDKADDPEASVEASLRLSFNNLEPPAQDGLCQLSVFLTSFDRNAAMAIIKLSEETDVTEILRQLRQRSLLEWDEVTEQYNQHDLVRALATAELANPKPAQLRYADYYARLTTGDNWSDLQFEEQNHVETGWMYMRDLAGDSVADALLVEYAVATRYKQPYWLDRRPQLEIAVAAAQRLDNRAIEAMLLNELAGEYEFETNRSQAMECRKRALAIYRELGDRRGEIYTLGKLGDIYAYHRSASSDSADIRQAIAYYREAEKLAGEFESSLVGSWLDSLASAYRTLGAPHWAIQYYKRQLSIARLSGARRWEMHSLYSLGYTCAYEVGDVHRALDSSEQALTIARELQDRYEYEKLVLTQLGDIHVTLSNLRQAVDYYEQVLVIYRELRDLREGRSAEYTQSARQAQLKPGNIRQAITYYEQALNNAKKVENESLQKDRFDELAHSSDWLDAMRKAIEALQNALASNRMALESHEQALAANQVTEDEHHRFRITGREFEADIRGKLGDSYADLEDWRRAVDSYEEALRIYRELEGLGEEVDMLRTVDKAPSSSEDIDQQEVLADWREEADTLSKLGQAYVHLKDTRRATDCYQNALAIYRQIEEQQSKADDLDTYTEINTDDLNTDENIDSGIDEETDADVAQIHQAIDQCEQALASIQFGEQEQLRRAITEYKQVLAIAREMGDREEKALVLNQLGIAYTDLEEADEGIAYYKQSLALFRELEDRMNEGIVLGNLGLAYYSFGDYGNAITVSERMLTIAEENNDQSLKEGAQELRERAEQALRDIRQSIAENEQKLTISRESGDRQGEMAALIELGDAYVDLQAEQLALMYYQQANSLAQALGDQKAMYGVALSLGRAYASLGELQHALAYYQQASALAQSLGNPGLMRDVQSIQDLTEQKLRDIQQAVIEYNQQLNMSHESGNRRDEAAVLAKLGAAYRNLGEMQQAIDAYTQALAMPNEIDDQWSMSELNWCLGVLLENQGDLEGAVERLQRGVDIERTINHPSVDLDVAYLDQVRTKLRGRTDPK
jgi:tetratricopeptide (TPR) repeat protein